MSTLSAAARPTILLVAAYALNTLIRVFDTGTRLAH
jgi:hypothetical protein